ncbi:putative transposable element [Colletotrichum incanum]|uniref:Putative transposable element n=1 Tax=Colletotrichum incanum TaxID=1573173 RepID=A0A166LM29_COLIC|nr:putative transposable element [Colletotrichum incanum]
MRVINRVQRIGAQAIIGTFNTVATAVAEAEASIQSAQERFERKAIKFWVRLQTLPASHPLRRTRPRSFKRHISPFQKMAAAYRDLPVNRLETIEAFLQPPWESRIHTVVEEDGDRASKATQTGWAVRAATGSSARNGIVGYGTAVLLPLSHRRGGSTTTVSTTVGPRTEQNPYTAELMAIAAVLESLSKRVRYLAIYVFSTNKAAVLAAGRPRQQSGQQEIRRINEAAKTLTSKGNKVTLFWLPAEVESDLKLKAKAAALPGKHTRQLYDSLSWKQASILAQLRTGMARLNWYLHQIGAAASEQCACGQAAETVEHFLFRCTQWTVQRAPMIQRTDTDRGNLSFYLGGKAASDPDDWSPCMDVVRETVKFAMATGRLDMQINQT